MILNKKIAFIILIVVIIALAISFFYFFTILKQYPQQVMQAVVDEAISELMAKGLMDKVAELAYSNHNIQLGFYSKADSQIVEIVKAVIDRIEPSIPLNIVENVTVITQTSSEQTTTTSQTSTNQTSTSQSSTTTTLATPTHTISPIFYTNKTVPFDQTLKVVPPQSILLSNNATEIAERLASILGELSIMPYVPQLTTTNGTSPTETIPTTTAPNILFMFRLLSF